MVSDFKFTRIPPTILINQWCFCSNFFHFVFWALKVKNVLTCSDLTHKVKVGNTYLMVVVVNINTKTPIQLVTQLQLEKKGRKREAGKVFEDERKPRAKKKKVVKKSFDEEEEDLQSLAWLQYSATSVRNLLLNPHWNSDCWSEGQGTLREQFVLTEQMQQHPQQHGNAMRGLRII